MVVNDGEILEAAGMLSNPTTHISLGIWKPRNCSAYINWIAVQSFPQMNTSGSDIIACKLLTRLFDRQCINNNLSDISI